MTQERETGDRIEFIEIQTTELCTADPNKIRIVAQAAPFPAGLLPYVAAVIPRASYSAEMGYVTWKEELRTHSIFASGKVTITQLGDREEAMEKLEELKRKLNDIWARRDSIDLQVKKRRIGPLEVYRLLPKTNCGKCGLQTCMAFAIELLSGSKRPADCVELKEDAALKKLMAEGGYASAG
jgi:ArsR family metal-binding transcriptional regulator